MYKVLIADDEEIIRRGLARFLKKDPELEVVAEAEDGEIALALTKEKKPDLLLVDINMPFLNGLELIEALQKAGREDLIGPGENCLVTPDREYVAAKREQQQRERILKAAHKPQQGRSAAASRNHLTSNARKDNHIGAKKKKYGPQKH